MIAKRYTCWKAQCSHCDTYQQDWRTPPPVVKCAACGRVVLVRFFRSESYVTPLIRVGKRGIYYNGGYA